MAFPYLQWPNLLPPGRGFDFWAVWLEPGAEAKATGSAVWWVALAVAEGGKLRSSKIKKGDEDLF